MPAVAQKNPAKSFDPTNHAPATIKEQTMTTTTAPAITQADVLKGLAAGEINAEQAAKLLDSLKTPAKRGVVTWKISEPRAAGSFNATDKGSVGGGLLIYGLGRMPFHFYASQWDAFYKEVEAINDFRAEHDAELIKKEA